MLHSMKTPPQDLFDRVHKWQAENVLARLEPWSKFVGTYKDSFPSILEYDKQSKQYLTHDQSPLRLEFPGGYILFYNGLVLDRFSQTQLQLRPLLELHTVDSHGNVIHYPPLIVGRDLEHTSDSGFADDIKRDYAELSRLFQEIKYSLARVPLADLSIATPGPWQLDTLYAQDKKLHARLADKTPLTRAEMLKEYLGSGLKAIPPRLAVTNMVDSWQEANFARRAEKWSDVLSSIGARLPMFMHYDVDEETYFATGLDPIKLRFQDGSWVQLGRAERSDDDIQEIAYVIELSTYIAKEGKVMHKLFPIAEVHSSTISIHLESKGFLLDDDEDTPTEDYREFLRALGLLEIKQLELNSLPLGDFLFGAILQKLGVKRKHFAEQIVLEDQHQGVERFIRALITRNDEVFSQMLAEAAADLDFDNAEESLIRIMANLPDYPSKTEFGNLALEIIEDVEDLESEEVLQALNALQHLGVVRSWKNGTSFSVHPLISTLMGREES
jgi:hypothetical protein